jgi:hypothetical protein
MDTRIGDDVRRRLKRPYVRAMSKAAPAHPLGWAAVTLESFRLTACRISLEHIFR